jgi:hypothetical protein
VEACVVLRVLMSVENNTYLYKYVYMCMHVKERHNGEVALIFPIVCMFKIQNYRTYFDEIWFTLSELNWDEVFHIERQKQRTICVVVLCNVNDLRL